MNQQSVFKTNIISCLYFSVTGHCSAREVTFSTAWLCLLNYMSAIKKLFQRHIYIIQECRQRILVSERGAVSEHLRILRLTTHL